MPRIRRGRRGIGRRTRAVNRVRRRRENLTEEQRNLMRERNATLERERVENMSENERNISARDECSITE